MKRRKLLIAAWIFAGLSLAGNAVLLWQRSQREEAAAKPGPEPKPESGVVFDAKAGPATGVQMDFSGTAFADDSWKLDGPKTEDAVKLDREFKWKEAGPAPAPGVETAK